MTELQQAAAQAWADMIRVPNMLERLGIPTGDEPMPAGIAIDFVQNVNGDRDDAVSAIINAAADWLEAQTPVIGRTEIDTRCKDDAGTVVGYIRAEGLGMAMVFLTHIRERCGASRIVWAYERYAATTWSHWADKAAIVIARCREVIEAAYPILDTTATETVR